MNSGAGAERRRRCDLLRQLRLRGKHRVCGSRCAERAARSRPPGDDLVDTPNAKTIAELVEQFNLPIEKTVKTLLVKAVEDSASPLVALLVRGDHELNEVKAEKLPQVASP